MPFIQRDGSAKIIGIYAVPQIFATEFLRDDDPALVTYRSPTLFQKLQPTDAGMVRAGEDVIVALLAKGTIAKADLPAAIVDKINARRVLRGQLPV